MDHGMEKQAEKLARTGNDEGFTLDALLHPARAFVHPMDVLRDTDLTLNEKRAILASWASDACAVEAAPDLRQPTEGAPIRFDDIMDALKQIDAEAAKKTDYGRLIGRARRIRDLYRPDGNGGVIFGLVRHRPREMLAVSHAIALAAVERARKENRELSEGARHFLEGHLSAAELPPQQP